MTCNICGVNDATVHLTEIVNAQMIEIHMCESCAQEKGTDFKTHFNFGDILSGVSDFEKLVVGAGVEENPKCSTCQTSFEAFTKSGRLGCPDCYGALSKMLLPLIKRVQRSTAHVGKRPSKISKGTRNTYDLRVLQDRLRKCIQMEEFEQAAKIRDEIKKMQDTPVSKKKVKDE